MKIIDNSSFLCDSKKILKKLQKNFIFYRKWYFFTEGKIIDEEDAYYLENSFSDFGSIGMCYYGVILLSGQGE